MKAVSMRVKKLGLFEVTLLCVSSILSLRNLPVMAINGTEIVGYTLLSAIIFFIPISMVCAELGSRCGDKSGGIFGWVDQAFGPRWGFFAVWLHWIEGVVCLPMMLYFCVACFYCLFFGNNIGLTSEIMVLWSIVFVWGLTALNIFSPFLSRQLSRFGTLLGTIFPAILILCLAGYWMWVNPSFSSSSSTLTFWPGWDWKAYAMMPSILLGFAGIEVTGYYVTDMQNPRRTFPYAIGLAVFIILLVYILGPLAIFAVLPSHEIVFTTGVLEAFSFFLKAFGLSHFFPILMGAFAFGGLSLLNTWILGPCKGILASMEGTSSWFLGFKNQKGMPVGALCLQALCSSGLCLLFLKAEGIESNLPYWLLTVIANQLFMILYALLFFSLIRLRFTQKLKGLYYQIPFGKVGLFTVSLLGGGACLGVFLLGFFPPLQGVTFQNPWMYAGFVFTGTLGLSVPGLWNRFISFKT